MIHFVPIIPDLDDFYQNKAFYTTNFSNYFLQVGIGVIKQIGKNSYIKTIGQIPVPYPIVLEADNASLDAKNQKF